MSRIADDDVEDEDVQEDVDGEQPDLDEDDIADISAVAEDVAQADLEGDEDEENGGDEGDQADDQDDDDLDLGGDSSTSSRTTEWGDMYVRGVCGALNAVVDEHGKPGAEPVDEQMARDLHLDEAFQEVMEKRGRANLPPEQEVMVGTLVLAMTVLITKTDLPQQVLQEVDV